VFESVDFESAPIRLSIKSSMDLCVIIHVNMMLTWQGANMSAENHLVVRSAPSQSDLASVLAGVRGNGIASLHEILFWKGVVSAS